MLDNMSVEEMKEAIRIIDGRAQTDCSGNVTKENIDKILIESGYYTKEQVYGNN